MRRQFLSRHERNVYRQKRVSLRTVTECRALQNWIEGILFIRTKIPDVEFEAFTHNSLKFIEKFEVFATNVVSAGHINLSILARAFGVPLANLGRAPFYGLQNAAAKNNVREALRLSRLWDGWQISKDFACEAALRTAVRNESLKVMCLLRNFDGCSNLLSLAIEMGKIKAAKLIIRSFPLKIVKEFENPQHFASTMLRVINTGNIRSLKFVKCAFPDRFIQYHLSAAAAF